MFGQHKVVSFGKKAFLLSVNRVRESSRLHCFRLHAVYVYIQYNLLSNPLNFAKYGSEIENHCLWRKWGTYYDQFPINYPHFSIFFKVVCTPFPEH